MWKLQKSWSCLGINILWEVCIETIKCRNLKILSNLGFSVLIKLLCVMNLTIILNLWISYHSIKRSHTVWIHKVQTRTLPRNHLKMNLEIGLVRMISRTIKGSLQELKGAPEKLGGLHPLALKTRLKFYHNHRIPTTENPVFSLWWKFRSTTVQFRHNFWKLTWRRTQVANRMDIPWLRKMKPSGPGTKTRKVN